MGTTVESAHFKFKQNMYEKYREQMDMDKEKLEELEAAMELLKLEANQGNGEKVEEKEEEKEVPSDFHKL